VIDLEERKKQEGDDVVAQAQADELLPPKKSEEAPETEHEETPEDQHVHLPPTELARLAGIEPAPAPVNAAAPTAEVAEAKDAKETTDAKDAPAASKELGDASAALATHAPESEHAEDQHEEHAIPPGEFGPQIAEDAQKEREKPPEAAHAPVDGRAALGAAASAAAGVASAAEAEHQEAAKPAAAPAAKQPAAAPAAGADGFAGMAEVGGKRKWNENAYYKHDNTTGFDVGGSKSVTLGKGQDGQVDAADAAVYATAAVETSGTYDAIQTYDKGILSFGIMQWTLHQGSLMKFLDYLKTKCGDDGTAAFHEHFDPLGLDVHGNTLLVGGATIKPDDAGRKQMDKLVRADKDTTRRWVVAFNAAGQDERVARAQWTYTKKQYKETAGNSLEKYVGFARKKGYSPKHAGSYRTPSFWCREPDAAALFFSMTTNNPGYSYYGVIKAADDFMGTHGPDPAKWPDGWSKEFLSIYRALLPTIINSWKGRVEKTLQHLELAREGKTGKPAATATHAPHKPPAPTAAPVKPAPAEIKVAAQQPQQPATAKPSAIGWLADVLTRKVVRGLEDASTAVKHFLGIATAGSPTVQHEEVKAAPPPAHVVATAKKIEQAAPKTKAVGKKAAAAGGKKGMLISADQLKKGKYTDEQYAFKQKVYETAVGEKAARKLPFSGVPDEDLANFEGKQLRKDVVPKAEGLLGALRAALDEAKAKGDPLAQKVHAVGISSGYRGPEHDFEIWDTNYAKYYEATHDAREATGDPHGADAVKILVRYISPRKAPPGYSNHTNGNAMDLWAKVGNETLTATYDKQDGWHKSWVFKWLTANSTTYGFFPYTKEAWHWELHE
jgi:hypothetical protein